MSIAELHGQSYLDSLRYASSDAVYVSTPFKSTINGTWQLSLSKRVSAAGVIFSRRGQRSCEAGAVRGTVAESGARRTRFDFHFSRRWLDYRLLSAARNRIWLRYRRQRPLCPIHIGKLDGVTRQKSDVDGVDRMFSVVHSPKFPVASVVAVAMNDVVANWLPQAEALGLGVAVIVLAIAFGTIMLAIRIEQLAAAREREAVQSQVAVQYKRFNNAMNNIVQGLAMYDKSGTLIACNKRYAEIYGLPLELTGPASREHKPSPMAAISALASPRANAARRLTAAS